MSIAIAFAAPASETRALTLPAGYVQVSDCERIFTIAGWVVAVGVSPAAFIVSKPRPQPPFPSQLLEQLAGYLVGRGANVVRTDIRFPWQWQTFGTLESTVRYWLKHFLDDGWKRRLFIALPPRTHPAIIVPLAAGAENALNFWEEVLVLVNALARDNPASLVRIRPHLGEVAHIWEQHWNASVELTAANSTVSPDDWAVVRAADRAWANVVREHLEPHGYRMEADSIARLL